jgi:hypothetical protein
MATDGKGWFSYPDGRAFKCARCGTEVPDKGIRWWNKTDKSTICDGCHTKESPQNAGTTVSSQSSSSTPVQPPTTKEDYCEVCGDLLPTSKQVHHLLRGDRIWACCFYCFQTVRRVRAIKKAGLWPYGKATVGNGPSTTPSVGSQKEADE